MRILALDLSLTCTGVATSDGYVGTWKPKNKGVERLVLLRDRVLASAASTDLVIIEDGVVRSSAAKVLGELHGVIKVALHEAGRPVVLVSPASVKKYATGRGNADKFAMLAAASARLGYAGESPDEADALWMLAMALDQHGQPLAALPALNRSALAAVAWPAAA